MFKKFFQYLLIKRSGIFDQTYYLQKYEDVRKLDINPIWHFVKIGWKEERNPSYLFDTSYYLNTYPDVQIAKINPLIHYLKSGGKEGRNPNPDFDGKYYLEHHRDVRNSNMTPLEHYVKFGIRENRPINANYQIKVYKTTHTKELTIKGISFQDEDLLSRIHQLPTTDIVDIVICVGPNKENITDCLHSIRNNTPINSYKINLVIHKKDINVINEIDQSGIKIHTHQMPIFNFSRANNIVIKKSKNDIVLLNDDTEVTEGWLEKLKDASKGFALTGAHTDKFCSGNPEMWEPGPVIFTHYPINMFCAYIPRRIIDVVGLLDEEFVYYGGEDVDYSIRTLQNGFPLIISDAFIIHKNNQSFGDKKERLMKESDKIIFEKYRVETPFDLSDVQPRVSAIMATHNRPELLQASIESIMMINYDNFELIIVDDCSSEQTNKVIIDAQNEHQNIQSVRLPRNLGMNSARKRGLDLSNGQFVFFTDDDDTVLPNRITAPLNYMICNPNLDVVYCDYNLIDDNLNVIPTHCEAFNLNDYLELKFNIGSGILFGRRNVFIDVPFYSRFDRAADYDWVFRITRKGFKIDHCPEIVMNYNRSGSIDQHLAGTQEARNRHKEVYERELLLQNHEKKI
jgi:GT2 family glycosyltransferase